MNYLESLRESKKLNKTLSYSHLTVSRRQKTTLLLFFVIYSLSHSPSFRFCLIPSFIHILSISCFFTVSFHSCCLILIFQCSLEFSEAQNMVVKLHHYPFIETSGNPTPPSHWTTLSHMPTFKPITRKENETIQFAESNEDWNQNWPGLPRSNGYREEYGHMEKLWVLFGRIKGKMPAGGL